MPFVFKNPDFGKWVYQFFSEFDVQKQIKKQWDNHSEGLEINASSHSGVCVPNYPFSNVDAILLFSKKEVMPSQEYMPNHWNPYPQVIPPAAGDYLVSVRSDEGTIETRVEQYFPDDDSWVWNEPHEILAFKAVPAPYNPKEGETKMTIYKEMKYQKRLPEAEKLAEGKVGVYKWKVLSHGTHPCGYVSVPENHPFYGKNCSEIEEDIEVHGGLTFSGKMKDSDDYWFGWDYAHAGDRTYTSRLLFDTEKSWTTQEVVDECLRVIEQFRSFEEK